MRHHHLPLHRFLLTLAGCSLMETTFASWYGPDPFRRERIEGRDFEYDEESFLHRFSYEPMPLLQPATRPPRDGIFGTGGSTRSNELYVRQQVQLSLPTETSTYLGYRFFRFEDFDGRYDQQWLGVGHQADGWNLLFWGDVTGSKKESDLQLEWGLHDSPDRRLRLIITAPDALYNSKTDDEDEYLDAPLTWYAEGRFTVALALDVYGFINWNQPSRFRSVELAAVADDEELSAGVGLSWRHGDWTLGGELEGLDGQRTREGLIPGTAVDQDLDRTFSQFTLEAQRPLPDGLPLWFGLRHLRFDEDDVRPFDPERWLEQSRQETYLYGGRHWQLSADWLFVPTLIGGYVDIHEEYPLRPQDNEDDNSFIGKLNPAFVLLLGAKRQGSITLNPTVYLHELGFGGGNVQLYFPL